MPFCSSCISHVWKKLILVSSPTNCGCNCNVTFLPPKGRRSAPWVRGRRGIFSLVSESRCHCCRPSFSPQLPIPGVPRCSEQRSRTLQNLFINCNLNPNVLIVTTFIMNLGGIFFFLSWLPGIQAAVQQSTYIHA